MFITPAFAQTGSGSISEILPSLLPFVLIFVIMYFLILRPQQKRVKAQQEMLGNLRRGDQVTLSGGVIGRITKVVDDATLEIEIADNVRIRAARQFVAEVRSKGEPAEEK
ncbi:preprotein translocase subunit YajC [Phreatobacter stygius]|uniref:Sec translocon accessory complex subunit YajC n=1 Tax=Phreatobacter stygius TaxID=1940610 RepID=A0A4D7BD17_9HYPH|nr:preprotein translocase subunit YajC [Phreatobacter stygius]QCI68740.1 preprotein translocase subunit YajC [Phreatobacter stygius]